jgi:two-component system nitrate/nitrite sensor histidine kinase NarX
MDERYHEALVLILTNIEEFRNAHKEILKQREELASASERDKIARELHDSLGQTMSLAVIQSEAAITQIEKGNHSFAALYLSHLKELLSSARDNLNDYVYGALETKYEGISIQGLLEKEADIFTRSCTIPIDLHISQDMRTFPFTGLQKLNLVGAVKEALNNVVRHAGASNVVISLDSSPGEISLCVEDDGIGLDFDEADQAEGAGMRTLEERAIALGGRRVVEPRPEGGTRVCLIFSPESPATP